MHEIVIPAELWSTSLLPEGILERWRVATGDFVDHGEPVAEVRIAESLHEILAPEPGVVAIDLPRNAVVEPGTVIGRIRALSAAV